MNPANPHPSHTQNMDSITNPTVMGAVSNTNTSPNVKLRSCLPHLLANPLLIMTVTLSLIDELLIMPIKQKSLARAQRIALPTNLKIAAYYYYYYSCLSSVGGVNQRPPLVRNLVQIYEINVKCKCPS